MELILGALNHAYYKITIGTGIGVIIISVLISAVSFGMAEFYPINAVPALATVIAESITLIATATISNKALNGGTKMEKILSVKDLSIAVKNRTLVKNISFDIGEGDVVLLSGKTV